jgi:hypothetical protein
MNQELTSNAARASESNSKEAASYWSMAGNAKKNEIEIIKKVSKDLSKEIPLRVIADHCHQSSAMYSRAARAQALEKIAAATCWMLVGDTKSAKASPDISY